MDLDPSQSQGQQPVHEPSSAEPPISSLRASRKRHRSTVHFAARSAYSSLSSVSDSGSEYSAADSDSGWIVTPVSSQEASSSQFGQRLDSSTSSLAADSDYLTDREGRPRPPTPKLSQTGAGGQPLRTTRTLRKEDTLMVIDTTQPPAPTASEVVANEVFALLEPRIRNLFIDMHNSDRDILIHYAHSLTESIRLQLTDELSELSRLKMEILELRMQVQRMRTGL
ncbi:hypothetical protein C8Q74DRAFT_1439074 [Fomes fomentarius]|nr:hypothetical protein C8Q74DRAFT_1439074 [Fomes fomentarius]